MLAGRGIAYVWIRELGNPFKDQADNDCDISRLHPLMQLQVMDVIIKSKRSMQFAIPPVRGFVGELLSVQADLLRFLHKAEFPAASVMPMVGSVNRETITATHSSFRLFVDFQCKTPEAVVAVRQGCRVVLQQFGASIGFVTDSGEPCLPPYCTDLPFERACMNTCVTKSMKDLRESFTAKEHISNIVLQLRINKRGVLEYAVVDLAEEPRRLQFKPATEWDKWITDVDSRECVSRECLCSLGSEQCPS